VTAPFIVAGSQDGPRLTMNTFLKNPAMVPQIVLDMTRAQFIGDALLRQGPIASGGSVMWKEATPLFSLESDEIVAEYAEIPGVEFDAPILHTKATTKRGLSVKASQEMIDRNDVNTLMDNMRRARNTLVRTYDKQFMATIFNNPSIPTMASAGTWFGPTTKIRRDIADAAYQIQSAYAGTDSDQRFGYDPDTIVINNTTASEWLDNDEIAKVFQGSPLASESLRYTGKMPRKFFGFDIIRSWQVPTDTALVIERGTVGFISDERPLRGTPLYEDRPRETWRSDFTRMTVMAADNPKAAMIITGINT
jgi:hypothetical protein